MLIALFGGTGFIGEYLVKALLGEGYQIRLALMGDEKFLSPSYVHPNLTFFAYDSQSEQSVVNAVEGVDRVINLAGILNEAKTRTFASTHIQLPMWIAKACGDKGVSHFIHISALGADIKAPSRYLRSKAEGEKAVLTAVPKGATIIRPSIVLGRDSEFVRLMGRLTRLTPILFLPCGLSRVQPIVIDDLVSLMMLLVKRDKPMEDTILNAAGPEAMTMRQLVTRILRLSGQPRMVVPIGYGLSYAMASVLSWVMPNPPISKDNCLSLSEDYLCPAEDNHSQQLLGKLTDIAEAFKS